MNCHMYNKNFGKLPYFFLPLTLLHSERPKLYGVLAYLSAIGLIFTFCICFTVQTCSKTNKKICTELLREAYITLNARD